MFFKKKKRKILTPNDDVIVTKENEANELISVNLVEDFTKVAYWINVTGEKQLGKLYPKAQGLVKWYILFSFMIQFAQAMFCLILLEDSFLTFQKMSRIMTEQKENKVTSSLEFVNLQLNALDKDENLTNLSFSDTDYVFGTLTYFQGNNKVRTGIQWVLKGLMLTILMAEVFPEIMVNLQLMTHVRNERKEGRKTGAIFYLWYFKFFFQAIISHTVLLLALLTIMAAQTEIAILNDPIGLLVMGQLNTIGSKLILEDFHIDFNMVFIDGDYLSIKIKNQQFKPFHVLMKMFRPNFFIMVTLLLIFWQNIFYFSGELTVSQFRWFLLGWVLMFLMTVQMITMVGDKILAKFADDSEEDEDENDQNKVQNIQREKGDLEQAKEAQLFQLYIGNSQVYNGSSKNVSQQINVNSKSSNQKHRTSSKSTKKHHENDAIRRNSVQSFEKTQDNQVKRKTVKSNGQAKARKHQSTPPFSNDDSTKVTANLQNIEDAWNELQEPHSFYNSDLNDLNSTPNIRNGIDQTIEQMLQSAQRQYEDDRQKHDRSRSNTQISRYNPNSNPEYSRQHHKDYVNNQGPDAAGKKEMKTKIKRSQMRN